MRVASPFNDYSRDALNLYRVIDPEIWVKLVGRVQGPICRNIWTDKRHLPTEMLHCLKVIHGNPTPCFFWIHCQPDCAITMPKNLIHPYNSGMKPAVALTKIQSSELEEHGYQIRRNGVSNYTLNKIPCCFYRKNSR